MVHEQSHSSDSKPDRTPPGDLGRQVMMRREQLGLSREQVAERAGSALGYIQYVEERQATPGIGFLLRLAQALETTVAELTGSTTELPPGIGRAGYHTQLLELGPQDCRRLLSTHGVGRIGVTRDDGPAILPVNYVVDGDRIAYRTAHNTLPATAADHPVAFEVDHIDEALSQGWSVLLVGTAATITDPEAARRLDELAYTTPWAGGPRNVWLTITPTRMTGRRIHVLKSHPAPAGGGPRGSST
ncbi:helix-turn-helix domain-containing protein [Streptomyces atratus]|uniref:helix-turn-helix domain-containing protein n=1 Tax=Streptomyces atratus TaxID=1893 RepID=UPI00225799B9|nr:pyridoxamine 5'-phosphate oxidase family protein [Streptomyces atratus]MCX5338764.1 pyridoxamine 5'-phosphate oxidase family protein [Streptomyces atratus]